MNRERKREISREDKDTKKGSVKQRQRKLQREEKKSKEEEKKRNTNRRKKTAARDKEDTDSRKDTKEGKKGIIPRKMKRVRAKQRRKIRTKGSELFYWGIKNLTYYLTFAG